MKNHNEVEVIVQNNYYFVGLSGIYSSCDSRTLQNVHFALVYTLSVFQMHINLHVVHVN